MSDNRKQHFIPEFYLADFTPAGTREDYLHVLDQTSGKQWRARPGELAHQRDFYRVELPDTDPNVFEKTFGVFEGQVADVLRRLFDSGRPPEGEDFSNLLFFIALMSVRIPRSRAQISKFINEIATNMAQMSVSSPERWEATKTRMLEAGHAEFAEMTYEEAKETFRPGRGTYDFHQTWHVGIVLERAKAIFPTLADRQWTIFRSDDEAGDFICSDYPASLVWADGRDGFYPPGHGAVETEISLPLSRSWAILGSFEGENGVYRATRQTVASINSRTGRYARQLYSPAAEFALIQRNGGLGTAADLLAWIAERKQSKAPPDLG